MLPRPSSHIQRDIAENRRYIAAGGEVAAGSLQSLEAELRAATGRRPARSTKPWPVSITRCSKCRTSGIAGTKCQCPSTPATPARHYTWPELRQRAHAMLDREALENPERLCSLPYASVRDMALRSIEKRSDVLSTASQDKLEALVRTRDKSTDGRLIARRIAATGSRAYEAAFEKGMRSKRSEERRVGKECRSRWSPYH